MDYTDFRNKQNELLSNVLIEKIKNNIISNTLNKFIAQLIQIKTVLSKCD